MVKVLFVCMGNICRSPLAEGVFRHLVHQADLVAQIQADSAGTHSYHIGAPPDPRSQATALRRGVDLGNLRARRVTQDDLSQFDYVLAMDRENYQELVNLCDSPELRPRIRLLLEFAPELPEQEVADPYYGGANGFERSMDLIEEAARGLLREIRQRHRL